MLKSQSVTFLGAVVVAASHPIHTPASLDTLWLLYLGPDQILPLTSFLGAMVGVLLMFWNRVVDTVRRIKKFYSRR